MHVIPYSMYCRLLSYQNGALRYNESLSMCSCVSSQCEGSTNIVVRFVLDTLVVQLSEIRCTPVGIVMFGA